MNHRSIVFLVSLMMTDVFSTSSPTFAMDVDNSTDGKSRATAVGPSSTQPPPPSGLSGSMDSWIGLGLAIIVIACYVISKTSCCRCDKDNVVLLSSSTSEGMREDVGDSRLSV